MIYMYVFGRYFDALRRNIKRCQYKRDLIMNSDNFQRYRVSHTVDAVVEN